MTQIIPIIREISAGSKAVGGLFMKKRILAAALILTLQFTFCGCNNTAEKEYSQMTSSETVSSEVSEIMESVVSAESSVEEKSENTSLPDIESSLPAESSEQSVLQSSSVYESSYIPYPQTSEFEVPAPDTSVVEDFEDKYFVKRLSREMQYYFCNLYQAAASYQKGVDFERPLTEEEISTLMYLLNYDCPELIHLSGDYYPYYDERDPSLYRGVGFIYSIPEQDYKSSRKKLDEYFDGLNNILSGKNELEKEKYVYDNIFYNCIYNESEALSGSVYGSLIDGLGRCEAISKGFMWCMRKLGIECLCVSGYPRWNAGSLYAEHSWNIVKIEDEWYHVDITVDNVQLTPEKSNLPHYGFFNASDDMISDNRDIREVYTSLGIPVCSSKRLNYHVMNNQLILSDLCDEQHFHDILRNHSTNEGIKALSVRFETKADYDYAFEHIEEWTNDFLADNTDKGFYFNTYYNNVSKTILTDVTFTNNAEG